MKWIVDIPSDFNFKTTVVGHGWYQLSPFHYLDDEQRLLRVEELASGKVVLLSIAEESHNTISVSIEDEFVTVEEASEILSKTKWILRLDEDLKPFHERCLGLTDMAYVAHEKHGRLLRSSTLFEDFVKVMLTTNTTWRRTISMTASLVDKLGAPHPIHSTLKAFPKPESIVDKGATFLKDEIRLGYRSDYIFDLATKVSEGVLDLDVLLDPDIPSEKVIKILKSIKGIGPYAQSTLLMILGIYGELPVDSEFRKHVRTKYFKGKDPSPKQIARLYNKWGRYKYLAYWFDRKA